LRPPTSDPWFERNVSESRDLIALDEVLTKLEKADSRAARVVELRFFDGLSEDEVAEVVGVSAITVKRDWRREYPSAARGFRTHSSAPAT
jgi:DNA-directed RNA polymerase specialized sigma24 family protein